MTFFRVFGFEVNLWSASFAFVDGTSESGVHTSWQPQPQTIEPVLHQVKTMTPKKPSMPLKAAFVHPSLPGTLSVIGPPTRNSHSRLIQIELVLYLLSS